MGGHNRGHRRPDGVVGAGAHPPSKEGQTGKERRRGQDQAGHDAAPLHRPGHVGKHGHAGPPADAAAVRPQDHRALRRRVLLPQPDQPAGADHDEGQEGRDRHRARRQPQEALALHPAHDGGGHRKLPRGAESAKFTQHLFTDAEAQARSCQQRSEL